MRSTLAEKQAFRLRMMRESRHNYLWACLGISLYALTGSAPWWVPLTWLVLSQLGCSVFDAMVRSGFNLRLKDPTLFMPQNMFSGVVIVCHLMIAPQLCFVGLSGIFLTWLFSSLWYDPRR